MNSTLWNQFRKNKLGVCALGILALFSLIALYAPLFASSKPLFLIYRGEVFFPLFAYLFYPGFYTKSIDLFFNVLMFVFPVFIVGFFLLKKWRLPFFFLCLSVQMGLFLFVMNGFVKDPAAKHYKTLTPLIRYKQRVMQEMRLTPYLETLKHTLPQKPLTLWQREKTLLSEERLQELEEESRHITHLVMPLFRPFHWEDDAGGGQAQNQYLPWWEVTRINRKDLAAALIFGIRISLVVGLTAVSLALLIGVPIGAISGYLAGKFDIITFRLIEIWEAMPTFFMLLLIVAIVQSKSIFLVIATLGLFGWTHFARFIRGEVLRQRSYTYVTACYSLGFKNSTILFSHILPNAIFPVLTLLPFSMMAAITSEAGLSFLGLGEEGSTSWGVLMAEARSVFPGESYLLWPPAILLTLLLVSIALVGDALRDALDPKMRR